MYKFSYTSWLYIFKSLYEGFEICSLGLSVKYDQVVRIIAHIDPFPDLSTVQFMITTEDMRFNFKFQPTLTDASPSSPTIILAKTNARRGNRGLDARSSQRQNKPEWSCLHQIPQSRTRPFHLRMYRSRPHNPDNVPEPIYPEYILLEDEHVPSAEEQPLPPVDSPTAESPRYVAESDPEEDPEEYEDDELEDGSIDYPIDRGDEGYDDDGDLFGDDTDDENEDKEEEEEHLASANAVVIVPTVEPVSLPKGTEHVIPLPFIDITTIGARITVWLQAFISIPPEVEVERLLAMPTPPPSPLTSLSPPSIGERLARYTAPSTHSSPPPIPSPSLPSSGCPTQIQALRIASTQALIDAVTAALPSYPLPPPLYIPPPVDRRDDILEIEMPHRKKSCLFALGPRYEVGESSTARSTEGREIDYGFVSTLDAEARTRISQRVTMDSQRVDLLMEDRIAHQETILNVEEEAYAFREAWAHSIGLSQAHYKLQTHREQVRQAQMVEILRVMGDMRREMGDMQAELLALRGQQRRARQPGSDARVLDHQDASRDTDSHI
nr:hybrid signal transduction histidine kinase M [Tanacetum cinerariifolium]